MYQIIAVCFKRFTVTGYNHCKCGFMNHLATMKKGMYQLHFLIGFSYSNIFHIHETRKCLRCAGNYHQQKYSSYIK